jgi:hypothetical protein
MEVTKVVVSRPKARELYREYKKHLHYQQPMDAEIQRAYQLISQGRVVIQALESIKNAGVGEDGYPRLAIVRADKARVTCRMDLNGGCTFDSPGHHRGSRGQQFSLPADSFPRRASWLTPGRASTPLVPVHLRPRRGLANYHILWEALWEPEPPVDPYLVRRIGGDLWLVVAAWDLTEVERAVMRTRMAS